MSKIYYIGYLYKSYNRTDTSKYVDNSITRYIHDKKNKLDRASFYELSDDDFAYLKLNISEWDNKTSGIRNGKINSILNQINFTKNRSIGEKIIYEIVEDKSGIKYAKEIITGLLFPLENNIDDIRYIYSIINNSIQKNITYSDPNLARFQYITTKEEAASINEINTYLNRENNKKVLDDFKQQIKKYYNENVFNKEIILKEKEELESQDDATILMEDIEYILNLLKAKNIELYNKHYNEYQKLYIGKNTNNIYIPKKRDFSNLLSKIKLSLLINDSKCNNITEFLDIAIENYFNKLISKEKIETNINLIDIENFTDMFLKSKDNYTIIEQRDIIKKISLLYIFVIKDNINNIDSSNLENSYFKENIKTMILNINELSENNIIVSVSLDFSKIYSLKETLDIIKNINFKEKDIKKLIK